MATQASTEDKRSRSPDPDSHALNSYDQSTAESEWVDEDENDDIDFELGSDESEENNFFEPNEEAELDFYDADNGEDAVEIEPSNTNSTDQSIEDMQVTEAEEESTTDAPTTEGRRRISSRVPTQIFQLLGRRGLQQLLASRQTGDSGPLFLTDSDETVRDQRMERESRRKIQDKRVRRAKRPQVPNEDGRKLMDHGVFGGKQRLAHKLMHRELGLNAPKINVSASDVAQVCHMFTAWKYYKTVIYPYGQWTITDATLSPDNRYLAYSSIRNFSDTGEASRRGWRQGWHGYSHFGIWSIRFSGDGREIVAGTSGPSVCVYDIERRQSIINIENGHSEDVNAVCFGDKNSPHILYSGSDDTLIKVWDRRSLGDGREAGVFMGHTEGLTYVDSRGDGRYVLSNGKDQSMKLWDLRKMMSTHEARDINPARYTTGFDYRFMTYSLDQYTPHPHDRSLVTFRGHSVLKTLIRCHFSPPGSTNSRYVYSGSEDGSVYVYNIDATLAGKIDVNRATRDSRPRDPDATNNYYIDDRRDRNSWKTCVRDASWHPNAPIVAATSWNGWGMSTGTCSIHSWNDGAEEDEGSPRMGQSVDQRLVPDEEEEENKTVARPRGTLSEWGHRLRSRRVTAANDNDNDEVGW
ncbi:uncharacterized protein KY384_001079 [Bacidia gigantensis]|uniref:uncharacterized protein n=1 Tax=Bacidia gigantensis TaxID=2732470 RepID=UPI001D047E8A|nr:uncharacterized protein KY384_001079 [Bacidia gigantensis]KAG8534235.1 hypothetical protein KY384_001079 [Bacidia gigantensis]